MSRDANGPPEARFVSPLLEVAWHSLGWLLVSSVIGLLLGSLLLFPGAGRWLGEWNYGRWMPLHLNLNLYGWYSLPLVAWLFRIYRVDALPAAPWSRTALWLWSSALAIGAIDWLTGHSSGKLFLDWQGYPRMLLLLGMLYLWGLLAWSFGSHWRTEPERPVIGRAAQAVGLVALLLVPFALYWAGEPNVYPPVNPDTGGPTGASLLGSTLGIVLILLLLPQGVSRPVPTGRRPRRVAWLAFAAQAVLCGAMGQGNTSHHERVEILGLGSLLIWVPILPWYFASFDWPANTRRWRHACLLWWALLVVSGGALFLPGVLDRFKFTDVHVGHAHLAMGGFVSSMNLFLLANLLGDSGRCLDSAKAFYAWQAGMFGYCVIMVVAGWLESVDLAFTFVPNSTRVLLYALRLVCGGLMAAAALYWWRGVSITISAPGAIDNLGEPARPAAGVFSPVQFP